MEILRLLDRANWIESWDNAPHHRHILTFPHHKHTPKGISENIEITLTDVLEEIRKHINPDPGQSD